MIPHGTSEPLFSLEMLGKCERKAFYMAVRKARQTDRRYKKTHNKEAYDYEIRQEYDHLKKFRLVTVFQIYHKKFSRRYYERQYEFLKKLSEERGTWMSYGNLARLMSRQE